MLPDRFICSSDYILHSLEAMTSRMLSVRIVELIDNDFKLAHIRFFRKIMK
jgi:hypothetical protein